MKKDLVFEFPLKFDCGLRVTINKNWKWAELDALIFGHSIGRAKFDKDFVRYQDMSFDFDVVECKGKITIRSDDHQCFCEVEGRIHIPVKGWMKFDESHTTSYYDDNIEKLFC